MTALGLLSSPRTNNHPRAALQPWAVLFPGRLAIDRVCVFIDGSNLYHGMKSECGRTDLDLGAFVKWLVADRRLVRTYYYNAPVSGDAERQKRQQRFFDALSRLHYFEVRLGRLEERGNTFIEKGVDVRITVDMLAMAYRDNYDVAILVSCDGDFADAVQAVQDIGKHVDVACFRKAHRLKQAADRVIALYSDSMGDLWLDRS